MDNNIADQPNVSSRYMLTYLDMTSNLKVYNICNISLIIKN